MQTLVAEVLTAWRRAERLMGLLPAGTAQQEAAVMAADSLRELYEDFKVTVEPDRVDALDAMTLSGELDGIKPLGDPPPES